MIYTVVGLVTLVVVISAGLAVWARPKKYPYVMVPHTVAAEFCCACDRMRDAKACPCGSASFLKKEYEEQVPRLPLKLKHWWQL